MSGQLPRPSGPEPERPAPPGMPRWVKVAGAVVLALVLVFVVLRLAGLGGDHGPGRHLSLGAGTSTAVAGPVADGTGP